MKLFITKQEILEIFDECVEYFLDNTSVRAMEFTTKLADFINEVK